MMRRLAQHLRLINTWCEDWLGTYIHPDKNTSYHSDGKACTHIWSCSKLQSHQNGPQSSSTELPGNWPGTSILLENGSCPYIRPARRNGQHSHLTWKELNPLAMNRMVHPLHLIKWELIPLSHQNGYSVLTLSVPGNWPGASIPRMAITLTSVLLDRMASTHIWHGREQPYHHDRMA